MPRVKEWWFELDIQDFARFGLSKKLQGLKGKIKIGTKRHFFVY